MIKKLFLIIQNYKKLDTIGEQLKILKILKQSQEGGMVIKFYEKNKEFNSKMRNIMVHLIIDYEVKASSNHTITSAKLQELSVDIVNCFPTESAAVYYSPYKKIGNTVKLSRGKLWDRYCNIRKSIRQLYNEKKNATVVNITHEEEKNS